MGYYNDLSLGDTDADLIADEGWHVADRRLPAARRLPASDLTIPPTANILALIKERYDLARLHEDYPGAGQLDRARLNIDRGARLAWSYGDLLIQSVNNPGSVYSVNRAGCTCPNGRAGRASCWHVCLYDLLIELQETAADTADMDAEKAESDDPGPAGAGDPPPTPPTPILLTQTPSGLTLTRGAESYTAIGPASLAYLIRELATPATPAPLGQRIAAARLRYLRAAA